MATKSKARAAIRSALSIFLVVTFMSLFIGVLDDDSSSGSGKSHECTRDVIDATVSENGSLHVIDARTYEFTGTYTLTAAVLDPPSGGEAIVNGVSVTDENGVTAQLVEVPFVSSWRTAGGPPSGCYAIDTARDTVYAFSTTSDSTKTFTFDYTYTNAVTQYADVSVLYWQFVAPHWDVSTENANAYVHLPVPAGQSVRGGENVYAFGHGSLNGSVSFEADGVIDFSVPRVKSGTFAEMRVAFPASWTPDVASTQVEDYEELPAVLLEEQRWQQEAQAQRLANALMLFVPLLVSLACIIVGIVLFFRYGREHKPRFDGAYWRDVPEKGTNPAVIARLMRWGKKDANDITAVLMHLSHLGVLSIERETEIEQRRILGDKERVTYRLVLDPAKRTAAQLDPIDEAALAFVFDVIAAGGDSVTLGDIEAYAKDHAQKYVTELERWQKVVTSQVSARDFFEKPGERCKTGFRVVAVILLAAGFLVSAFAENFVVLIGLAPGAIALFALSYFMPRRSREAVDVKARCDALKRWFKDFTNLKEAIPTDAKVWGELLVYAYLFGVAEQVVADLNRTVPEIWNEPAFSHGMLWYYNPYGVAHMGAASAGFFGNAFENTLTSAQSALSSASSGGGFGGGGGFSGGGGGGFGGGGGGFSR